MDDPVGRKKDELFEPTIDMMVNDFDDEATLEEEENLADPSQDQNELDNLQREGELPIEELLRLYNCPPPPMSSGHHLDRGKPKKPRKKRKHIATTLVNNNNNNTVEDHPDSPASDRKAARLSDDVASVSGDQKPPSPQPPTPVNVPELKPGTTYSDNDEEELAANLFRSTSTADDLSSSQPTTTVVAENDDDLDEDEEDDDDDEDLDGPSELVQLLDDVHNNDEEEEEADYDYYPEELDLKKSILVGENHQAVIPESVLPRNNKQVEQHSTPGSDQLLWSPHSEKVTDGAVERFLASFYRLRRHLNHPEEQQQVSTEDLIKGEQPSRAAGAGVVKDEESALRKLLEADYNVEIALQQVCNLMQTNGGLSSGSGGGGGAAAGYCATTPVVTWSEEECRNFELGIRLYGKNFTLIQATKVASRSVQELVQFYYFWKKTERYDSFAAKQRLEKKRHSMSNQNPGLTEFMDRFLEEQPQPQQQQQLQSRSISPRQQQTATVAASSVMTLQQKQQKELLGGSGGGGGGGGEPVSPAKSQQVAGGGGGGAAGQEESTGGGGGGMIQDGNHSLLIYADSKRHRTSGGGGVPTTPPVATADGQRQQHPLEELMAGGGKGDREKKVVEEAAAS